MSLTERQTPLIDAYFDAIRLAGGVDVRALLERFTDWEKPVMPVNGQRGGGSSAPSDDDLQARADDRQASRYATELRQLLQQHTDLNHRLHRLQQIGFPPNPVQVGKHMQAAQIAAEGWCVSCWRNDRTCNPIALRASGQPYYRDRCRPCGEWHAEHGQDPPLSILQKRHQGTRVTQKDVEKALGRSG